MLPPTRMLTIKIRAWTKCILSLASAAFLAGCLPPGPRALLDGRKLLEKGRYTEAVERLKVAVSLLRTNADAWNYLGLACQQAGMTTNAVQAYQTALGLNHDLAEVHYNLGCLWLNEDRLEPARAELTTYTGLRKNSADGWIQLGIVQLRSSRSGTHSSRQQELAAAEKSFSQALQIGAGNPEALNGLGLVEVQRSRPRDAVRFFNEALKQHPACAPALLNLAVVSQLYLNDSRSALEKYREYLALPGPLPDRDAVQAVADDLDRQEQYIYHSPPKPVPGDHLSAERAFAEGVQAQRQHRLKDAIQFYRQATQKDPAYYDAYYNLGSAALAADQLPLSLVAYEYALALRPDSADARYNFALALKQANYFQDAAHELEVLLKGDPRDVRSHLALGNLEAQELRQPASAREHYRKVLEYDPRNPQADAIRHWLAQNP
jgi:tetratricopeptide (TPR) repeat protein